MVLAVHTNVNPNPNPNPYPYPALNHRPSEDNDITDTLNFLVMGGVIAAVIVTGANVVSVSPVWRKRMINLLCISTAQVNVLAWTIFLPEYLSEEQMCHRFEETKFIINFILCIPIAQHNDEYIIFIHYY